MHSMRCAIAKRIETSVCVCLYCTRLIILNKQSHQKSCSGAADSVLDSITRTHCRLCALQWGAPGRLCPTHPLDKQTRENRPWLCCALPCPHRLLFCSGSQKLEPRLLCFPGSSSLPLFPTVPKRIRIRTDSRAACVDMTTPGRC